MFESSGAGWWNLSRQQLNRVGRCAKKAVVTQGSTSADPEEPALVTTKKRMLTNMSTASNTAERCELLAAFHATKPSVTDMVAFYDAWGPNYYHDDLTKGEVEYHNVPFLVQAVRDLVPASGVDWENAQVLDVGAGTGILGAALTDIGFKNIDALDGSKGMLEQAEALGVYKTVHVEVLDYLTEQIADCGDEAYDLLVSAGTFFPNHVPGVALTALMKTVKKNGHLVIGVSPHSEEAVGMDEVIQEMKHDNLVRVLKTEYIPRWYSHYDGTLYVLEKLM